MATSNGLQEHIRGLREAKAAFQALPLAMRTRTNEATETTVREIARGAQSRLQSNPSIRTRTLYNAIGWSQNKNNGRGKAGIANVSSSIMIAGAKKMKIRGTLVPARNIQGQRLMKPTQYGPKVEFGTRHSKAEPFMIPAAKSQEKPYLDRMVAAGREVERDLAAIGMRNL